MTVVNGFNVAMMILLLVYSFYRFIRKKSIIMLIPICAQIFATALALRSFINDVEVLLFVEIIYVLFGLILPMSYIIVDYSKMNRKFKNGGIYTGLVEQSRFDVRQKVAQSLPQMGINPLIREKQTIEIMKDIGELPEETRKNFKKCLNHVHAMIQDKNLEDSFYIYETLCKVAGSSYMLYFNHAGLCNQMRRLDNALKAYKKALELAGDDKLVRQEIYYNMGNTYYMLNQFDKACKYFERVLELNPDNQQALENLSFSYVKMGKTERGIETLKKLNTEESNYRTHFVWGVLFREAGKLQEAEEELKKSLLIQSDSAEVLDELGKVLMKQNKTEEAVNIYEKLIRINPDSYQAWYGKACANFKIAHWKKAVNCYLEAIRIKPDCFRSYYNMAAALEEEGNEKAAIESYHSAIAINPDFTQAYNNLGILLSTMGRREEALEIYEEGIRRNSKQDSLYFNMGMCLYEEGRFSEAAAAYRNALDINPDGLEIYYYLGSVLTEMHNYNDAIDAYKSALEIKPSDSELYYHLATIYALLRRNDISMENLQKAMELDPEVRKEVSENRAFDGMRGKSEFKKLIS